MSESTPTRSVCAYACAASVSLLLAAPAAAATVTVASGGDLQAALNAAQPGDTLLLESGATFIGNFVLPVKPGTTPITIRSSAQDSVLPGPGVRMTPPYAGLLAKLQSPNSSPALATAPGAHDYTIALLEFAANYQGYGDILDLGDGSSAQNTLAAVPHDLVVDRVYVHGDPTAGQKRGIGLNSASTTVMNSYIADIKAVGQDSQAICGWNGPGPFTITNNYLEAAGENILFGGADPSIAGLVPSDITVTQNYLSKPMAWMSSGWQVKNLFELKNAQRVVIDRNIMENNWAAAQPGYAVLFTPRNQDGTAPWSVVQSVQFTNNIVRHVSSGINLLGTDDGYTSQEANAITIRNNFFQDVSAATYGGSGRFLLINGGVNIVVDHNTVLQDGSSAVYAYGTAVQQFVFTNNLLPPAVWTLMGDAASPGNGTVSIYFPNAQFTDDIFTGAAASQYPAGNFFPATMDAIGFVNLQGGDYRLAATSPYATAATDGTAIGCAMNQLPGGTASASGAAPAAPTGLRILSGA